MNAKYLRTDFSPEKLAGTTGEVLRKIRAGRYWLTK
jgi:hypothetical protein